MLKAAGADKQHFDKDVEDDLKIRIIKLGRFAMIQLLMIDEKTADILIRNIQIITNGAMNIVDKSWTVRKWINFNDKEILN